MDLFAYVPNDADSEYYDELYKIIEKNPVLIHNCKEPDVEDEIITFMRYNPHFYILGYWFLFVITLYKKHPLTYFCLKSQLAINYEINKHLRSHPFMIHPFSIFRIIWETLMIIYSFIVLIISPMILAFYQWDNERWFFYGLMDLVILCDIIVWFFTGYFDYRTKLIVLRPTVVASQYLKTWFLVDILPLLPFCLQCFEYMGFVSNRNTWYHIIINLLKIIRIRILIVYLRRVQQVFKFSFQQYKIIEMIVIFFITAHWSACMEYYIPLTTSYFFDLEKKSWIWSDHMKRKTTVPQKYLLCFNKAIIALCGSTSFIQITSTVDIIINLILTEIGFIGFVYIQVEFLQLLITFRSTEKKKEYSMQQLQEYMRYKELPHSLQERLVIYMEYKNKKGFERDWAIMSHVSPCLRDELLLHSHRKFLRSVRLFKYIPKSIIPSIAAIIASKVYLAGDTLATSGTVGHTLLYIVAGTIAVYNNAGEEVCHLEDGAHLGTTALLFENEYRSATVVTIETCEISTIARSDFQKVMDPHPELRSVLKNIVLDELKTIPTLEEAGNMKDAKLRCVNISNIHGKQ